MSQEEITKRKKPPGVGIKVQVPPFSHHGLAVFWFLFAFGLGHHLSRGLSIYSRAWTEAVFKETHSPFAAFSAPLWWGPKSPASPSWIITRGQHPPHTARLSAGHSFLVPSFWVSLRFHRNPTWVKVLPQWPPTHHKPLSIAPVLRKEPEGMQDVRLSVVFQVSKFKYITPSDSFNYYSSNCTTREGKKKIYHKRLFWGKGEEDGGTLECFIYGNTANYLNKFLY